jgi:hypothetical protein
MRVGKDLHTGRSPTQIGIYQCCIDTIDSPDDEHKVAGNMQRIEINIHKRNCASSCLFIRINRDLFVSVKVPADKSYTR